MRNLPEKPKEKTVETGFGVRYRIERSFRRSCQITVGKDGVITVKMPLLSSDAEAEELIYRHRRWVLKRIAVLKKESEETEKIPKLSEKEKRELKRQAQAVIPERTAYFAQKAGVDFAKISYRFQRSRWGSCTRTGNLSFNCLLMLAPPEVLDCVVVHELCHRKVMAHSPRFYGEILKVYPEYRKWNEWLKKHGRELMGRV